MELILMRHALAEERSERYPDDGQRPLSKDGRRRHRGISQVLQGMGVRFDELISSPLVRARETAEITGRAYGWTEPIVETDALGSGFSPAALVEFLNGYDESARLLCVGHEPDLSDFAARLLSASGRLSIAFRKSAVLGLEFPERVEAGAATLLYFLKPGHLARLARDA
ncbi:MAG: histidine phosphatase family protein [Gemmatimonadota bacterium]